ncbi:RNA-guided endonuclease InsQ/TnpB family protein [Planococcus lenghuensis]|uniref:Transposase n=1 Tax=Planococcus lenghuensis TaxID=2213202 RepID=A0A1Q2L0M5_9BACL|nr:RNA-guided endonuclease TnpB family protein [Planococcus lenghuensis]AQQ53998.1 transposase [Planococcus lenghuensis]
MPTLTMKLELMKPTRHKQAIYRQMTELNTRFANWLLGYEELARATSAHFRKFSDEKLPSAIVNQTIREVTSKKKNQKAKIFRRQWCVYNNQNFRIEHENGQYKVSFPTQEKRVGVPVVAKAHQLKRLELALSEGANIGTAMLHEKKGKWFVSVSFAFATPKPAETAKKMMGIDVGLDFLAVGSIGTHACFFSGREVAFHRRRHAARRKQLGKAKKLNAIRKSKGKEAQWMKEMNHLISRRLVDFAVANGVRTLRMEDLTGIRHSAKSKKEAGRNLHSWAHYQLQEFIAYKAAMAGIQVEYVKPDYTSQTCKCGHAEKANRKRHVFRCRTCGYQLHADLNAAINIAKAISGLSATKKAG